MSKKSDKPKKQSKRKPTTKRAVDRTTPDLVARAVQDATPGEEARPAPPPRTPAQSRLALKKKVRMFYDLQRLRLQCAGRTTKRPEGTSIDLHEVDIAILGARARELELAEKHALADVADHLKTLPFYLKVLSDKTRYRGIGPTMAGVIMAEFDIHREDTVSKMWAFAGLRPMPATRCKACHEVVQLQGDQALTRVTLFQHSRTSKCPQKGASYFPTYESGQTQRPTKGEKLNYNAWLRTKLVGVLGTVMLKVGSPWKKVYDEYKHRKATAGWGKSDAHRHQAAIRYMIKMLLVDIHREWRTLEGLPVREPYPVQFQGAKPHAGGIAAAVVPAYEEAEDPEVAAELDQVGA